MVTQDYDAVVIGGGIAGSSAARSLSLNGVKTLIVEKNSNTEKPGCAEAVTSYFLPLLPFEIPKNQLKMKIDGIKFYSDGLSITQKGKMWEAFSIEREDFNPWLTNLALNSGAKLSANSELVRLKINDDGYVSKLIITKNKKNIEINPKLIIAADGAKSTVAKELNLIKERKASFAYITSFEMSNLNITNPKLEQIFFDDYIPKGFAYIFPKSLHRANIGAGSVLFNDRTEEFFDEFINFNIVNKQLKGGKVVVDRSGFAPVDYCLENNVYKNVIFTGDAANQNIKPFIEGILPGIICGNIAGECGSNYLKNNAKLTDYDKIIDKKFGEIFSLSDQILSFMLKIFEQKDKKDYLLLLALCSDLFKLEKFDQLFDLSYQELRERLQNKISNRNLQH